MGLFDLIKKICTAKKQEEKVSVTFSETIKTPQYEPSKDNKVPLDNNYAIAAFIKISLKGAKVGRNNDDYPRYFNYEYGVNEPIKYHRNVIEQGYLIRGGAEYALRHYKVEQLKEILNKNSLLSKGKKDDLIKRIIEEVDITSLNLEAYYIPSEKGFEHYKKYGYVFTLKDFSISTDEYNRFKLNCKEYLKPNDIIWQLLNQRYITYSSSKDYGLARSQLLCMGRLLEDENRYTDALCSYVKVLYYDTSGCGNNGSIERKEGLLLASGIIDLVYRLKDYYIPEIIENCYSIYLPNQYVNKRDFERLVMNIFKNENIDLKNYIS